MPLGVNRTWVKYIEKGAWPDTKRFFSVMRCNQCTDAPCVEICPTTALWKRKDGIVDFDTDRCIGCKSCMQACPYDALYIDPGENTAQKCNYCVHRTEIGLEPACAVVCPEEAIIAGDLDDPTSRIAQLVATTQLSVRSPEQGTGPNVFYKGVEEASLDPLGASSLGDGGGIWRDTEPGTSWLAVDLTEKKAPDGPTIKNRQGEPPRVVYNTDHPAPWGWRVSSYFLTKGISAGITLAIIVALLRGASVAESWIRYAAPLVSGVFLLLTGVLLVADLKRPDRFFYLLTKGNPGSWLVRGAWILSAYAVILGLWILLGITDNTAALPAVIWIAGAIALGVAGYTAFLFGQAEARDLWQSPLLLWHMIAGAFAAGGGAGAFFTRINGSDALIQAHDLSMVIGAAALGLIALGELISRHPTRNSEAAMHHMTKGRFAREWWFGGQVVGVAVPVVFGILALVETDYGTLGIIGGFAAMIGIWLADNAFVKAGQSVPLS